MVVVFLDVFFTGDGKFDGKSVDFSDKVFLHVCMYVCYVCMCGSHQLSALLCPLGCGRWCTTNVASGMEVVVGGSTLHAGGWFH